MITSPLTRRPSRTLRETSVSEEIRFVHGRVHEICGPARRTLALRVAAALTGPILWLRPGWERDQIAADGMAAGLNPARLVFVAARRSEDLQWCVEEALRSGAAPIVIAECSEPPGLTPVRRLHLAAEAGGSGMVILLLTPETGGAQGVETRWHAAPAHDSPEESRWTLTRLRARMAPPRSFALTEPFWPGPRTSDPVAHAAAG